jgi:hypothetical protein
VLAAPMIMVQVMRTVQCILRGLRDGDVVGEFTRMVEEDGVLYKCFATKPFGS